MAFMTQKPLILAIETSSKIGSIGVGLGQKLLAETTFSGPMRHSAELFPSIQNLLSRFGRKPKEIEHIYISAGPGSFTGLRLAVTLAKTMHLANLAEPYPKIIAVDTLDVIAANVIEDSCPEPPATNHGRIAPILDAKRSQFYTAVYECTSHGICKKILPDSLMTADEFLGKFACQERPIWLLGDGLLFHKNKFKAQGVYFLDEKYWSPKASKVHLLGWKLAQQGKFADPITLQPKYLRGPDVTIKQR